MALAAFASHARPPPPARVVRSLVAGLPTREQALQRQRDNLQQFADDNKQKFDAMPYEAWTSGPSHSEVGCSSSGLAFEVRASKLVPGLRGVFPCQPVRSSSREQHLLNYYGMLLTDRLYESFYKQYYCPTGLELPPLAYNDGKRTVKVLILGDPTCLGALINDGRYGRNDGQSKQPQAVQSCLLARGTDVRWVAALCLCPAQTLH